MSEKLKPCPFCGRTNMNIYQDSNKDSKIAWPFYIWCSCEIHGPFRKTERGAIAAWNRRAK